MIKYRIDEIEFNFHSLIDKNIIASDEFDAKNMIVKEIANNPTKYLDIYLEQVEDLSDNIDMLVDEKRLEEIERKNDR